jgi:hypothetical protein
MTFKPWTGTLSGRLFCGAMERKTGLSNWPILSRIAAAAQFRGFGLAALAHYFFRFVSWPVEVDARYRVTLKYSAQSSSVRPAAACSSAARTNSSITERCVTSPRRASLCNAKAVAVETQTFIRRSPLSPAVARFFRYAACRSAVVLAIATPLHGNRIAAG